MYKVRPLVRVWFSAALDDSFTKSATDDQVLIEKLTYYVDQHSHVNKK